MRSTAGPQGFWKTALNLAVVISNAEAFTLLDHSQLHPRTTSRERSRIRFAAQLAQPSSKESIIACECAVVTFALYRTSRRNHWNTISPFWLTRSRAGVRLVSVRSGRAIQNLSMTSSPVPILNARSPLMMSPSSCGARLCEGLCAKFGLT